MLGQVLRSPDGLAWVGMLVGAGTALSRAFHKSFLVVRGRWGFATSLGSRDSSEAICVTSFPCFFTAFCLPQWESRICLGTVCAVQRLIQPCLLPFRYRWWQWGPDVEVATHTVQACHLGGFGCKRRAPDGGVLVGFVKLT